MATNNTPTPCDLLEFLAQERSMKTPAVAELLGQWLLDYEPGELAKAKGARPRSAAPRPRARAKSTAAARHAA